MSSDVKTLDAASLLAGSVMVRMTVVMHQMNQRRSVPRGPVSRISSDAKTTDVSQAAGSVITTTTVGTIRMRTSVCLDSAQKVSLPAPMAAVLPGGGSVMGTMTVLMDLMSMAVI